jgi:uncharacterized cupredoxin-like copper-binding protein
VSIGTPFQAKLAVAAVALALSAGPAGSAAPTRVSIVLTSHRFTPSPIHLSGGIPVRLTIANQSGETHDFHAPEFFHWSKIQRGRVPGGKLRLRSGERAILTLTPRRGSYKLKCTRFGHAFLGMSTMIIVH